jgi:DinB superfamily
MLDSWHEEDSRSRIAPHGVLSPDVRQGPSSPPPPQGRHNAPLAAALRPGAAHSIIANAPLPAGGSVLVMPAIPSHITANSKHGKIPAVNHMPAVKEMSAAAQIEDPRYPIGRFAPPPANTAEVRAAHIETLRQLPSHLRKAVSGLNDAQLDTPYRDSGWTVRQVVHHVADSHTVSYIRFKLALTEDWPTVKPYDEVAWANLADSRLPIHHSLVLLDALHARWVTLLESLSAEDFKKGFDHPDRGRLTLEMALAGYDWHSRHHTAHITSLRERMGW